DDVEVTILASPKGTGFSSETVMFDAVASVPSGGRRTMPCVARIEPTGYGLYQAFDLEAQWRIIDALAVATNVPVPRIIAHDTSDAAWLGRPFFVMERIDGVVAADSPPYTVRGWLVDATPGQRRRVYRRGMEVLADIHRTEWARLG